ncbi:MAG: hypothetical protein E3J83_04295 [Candidatus Atribacteria bacterium]|nr:MAG: hypothetical protein E3J83_04295 [Candidatus Atribacteria bacterium]
MANLEDWGIDELIKKGGVMIMNPKEVKMTKKEQLRAIFKKILEDWGFHGSDIDNLAYLLLKEVTIRTNL